MNTGSIRTQPLEKSVVQAVIGCLDPKSHWQAVILDYELREVQEGYDSDYVGIVLVLSDDGGLTQDQFQLDRDARGTCVALYEAYKQGQNPEIAGFTVRIEADGQYRFDFKQEVKRLNGIWDTEAETYFDNYLTHYQRERAAADGSLD